MCLKRIKRVDLALPRYLDRYNIPRSGIGIDVYILECTLLEVKTKVGGA
jgi:hypothetical protein